MFSIIIPTYNERENIRELVMLIESSVAGKYKYEIIFVDDNSPDLTWKEIDDISKAKPYVRLVRRSGKLGLTSAVLAGVAASKNSCIIVMDADLSHPPNKLPDIMQALSSNADLVVCSRLIKGGGVENWPFHRKMISSGATSIAKVILGVNCSDPMSGFFGVKKELLQNTRFRVKGYKILLNILADNPDIELIEIPYMFSDRKHGKTKLGNMEIIRYIDDVIKLRFS